MKTIFELIRIETNSKAHYPIRKTHTTDLGLFSTLAKAEKQLHKDVKDYQDCERERLKDIAEDEEIRNDEKHFGHNVVLAYKITEIELDTEAAALWQEEEKNRDLDKIRRKLASIGL